MNILQLITGLAMGGAEKMVVDLSIECKKQNQHTFYVVSLTNYLDRKYELEQHQIPVYSLSVSKNLTSLNKGIRQLKAIIDEHNIELVHVHMFHGFIVMLLSGLANRVPIVFTGHNTNFGNKSREYILWATKSYRKYDIIFEPNQLRFFHKKGNKTKVIPNGIDVESIREKQAKITKNSIFTFINVGNIEKQKNQISFIKIALELKKYKKPFQIQIVGEGSKKPELQNAIQKYDLEDEIKLLGKRMDVPELMAAAHCFVMPSLWEGMPITILEAGISKIPVISTAVGNNKEILANNRGIVSDIENFPKHMANHMRNYDESKLQTDSLFSYIQHQYSIESIYNKHVELYLEAVTEQ